MSLTRFTVLKDRNYTTINNSIIKDKRISLKAKGLFLTIMSLPDTWDFSVPGIVTVLLEGESAIYAAIKELVEFGYCIREVRREAGRFAETCYTFTEAPHRGFPHVDIPRVENRGQLNTKEINSEESISPKLEIDGTQITKYDKRTKDPRSGHPAIKAVMDLMRRYPDKGIWDRIIKRLGPDFDLPRLTECREVWLERGHNPLAVAWLNWYFDGIPDRGDGVPRGDQPSAELARRRAKDDAMRGGPVNPDVEIEETCRFCGSDVCIDNHREEILAEMQEKAKARERLTKSNDVA